MASQLTKQVQDLVKREWNKTIKPNLTDGKRKIVWMERVTDPLPREWPGMKKNDFAYYAYGRGMDIGGGLSDGEFAGKVWAKVTTSPELKLTLISNKLVQTEEIVGVRPLKPGEIKILQLDPVELLNERKSAGIEAKIKSYYCLQKSLGNIPNEVIALHESFFKWLGCNT